MCWLGVEGSDRTQRKCFLDCFFLDDIQVIGLESKLYFLTSFQNLPKVFLQYSPNTLKEKLGPAAGTPEKNFNEENISSLKIISVCK